MLGKTVRLYFENGKEKVALDLNIEVDINEYKKQKGRECSDISDNLTDNDIGYSDNHSDNSQKQYKYK